MTSSLAGVRRRRRRTPASLFLLVAPFVVLFLAVYVAPMVYAVFRSLFHRKQSGIGFGAPENVFVGFANYIEVLTSVPFWEGCLRILVYGIFQITIMIVLAIALALLLDSRPARAVPFFRLGYFLPYAIPGIVAALLWAYLYVPQLSPVLQVLENFGITVNLLGQPIVLFSIANIGIWAWTGYNMFIYIAALQAIPGEVIEAARLDGANEWTIALRIKAPMIRGSVALTVLLSIIGTIQLFSEPKILQTVTTSIGATYTPMMMAYNATFTAGNIEYGSAISVVIAVLAGLLALVHHRVSSRPSRKTAA